MSVTDIGAARWAKSDNPNDHNVRDVLVESLRQLDCGELAAEHVVVVFARHDEDGAASATYFQGGLLSPFGALGSLMHAQFLMLNG